ncbi:MAG: hypothetical protein HZB65_04160 [Candidatus Aenigmarchaeota archaeon]|nr:hypothetical protein [Candidatus Aenigmarchaeota archaeon]
MHTINHMPDRVPQAGADMIILVVLVAVILVIFTIIGVQSASVGGKAGVAGAPGVVKSAAPAIEYADKDGARYYLLKIMKIEHEEGKVMNVVPVINAADFVYRPSGLNNEYPVFSVPGDIEAVFNGIPNLDVVPDGTVVHVSLWETGCLDDIGFVSNNAASINDISYSTLVRKCSGSYLTAYDVMIARAVGKEAKE